jgi:RHS repeat-associated protein
MSRLSSWQGTSGGPTVSYQYDGDGNMLSRMWSGETVTFARNWNSLTKTTTPSGGTALTDLYSVDGWGRTTDTPAVGLTYDAGDQIINVLEKSGSRQSTLIYDGLGNRVATTYGVAPGGDYLLTLMHGLYEYRFTAATGEKEDRCRVMVDGRAVGDVVTSSTVGRSATFYLNDNMGSPVAEVGSAGTVNARLPRDPYGNLITDLSHPSLPADVFGARPDGSSTFGFAERDREPNWGLVDMLARHYSPALGQFISPDPVVGNLFDRRDYNPFAYARNSPTALRDPTGLYGEPEGSSYSSDPGSSSGVSSDWPAIKSAFKKYIEHDVGEVFFVQWIGDDFFGDIVGHDIGRVFFGRWIGQDFFGNMVPGAAKDVWNWITASGPAPVPVPTAQSPSTSSNGEAHANTGAQGGGTTENHSGVAPVSDAVEVAASAAGNIAERTPVYVWAPNLFGGGPLEGYATVAELEENPMLASALEGRIGMGQIKFAQFAKGFDQGVSNGSAAISLLEAHDKMAEGDPDGAAVPALEALFTLTAARMGPLGAIFSGLLATWKFQLSVDKMGQDAGMERFYDPMGGVYWFPPSQ